MIFKYLKKLNECEGGDGVYNTVNSINGVGDVVTPDIIATGAVEQSDVGSLGSGDKFTGISIPKTKKKVKRYYVTIKNKDGFGSLYKVKENLSYNEAVSMCEELNSNINVARLKLYGRPIPEYVVYEMNEIKN